jgi:membrane protein
MAGALAVRLFYCWSHPMETRDGIGYIQFTQRWFEEGTAALPAFLQTQPPLFCYLSRALMFIGLSAEAATQLVNLSAGTLLLIPVYFAGKLLFNDKRAGLWLGALSAVMPTLVKYSCERLREGLYFFFAFWVICFWLHAVKQSRPMQNAFLCGLCAVLSLLCRYEALELLVFCGIGLPAAIFFPDRAWKNALKAGFVFVLGALLGVAVIRLLPGMPDILTIFVNRIWSQCLGTSINPV